MSMAVSESSAAGALSPSPYPASAQSRSRARPGPPMRDTRRQESPKRADQRRSRATTTCISRHCPWAPSCGPHRPGGSIAPAPTATTCSHSYGPHVGRPHRAGAATPTTKPSGSPTPAAGFAINARSTPKPGVSTAHANKKSPTAHGATTCAKCSSCSKAPNRGGMHYEE